jgi:hypothetical protein
VAACVPADNDDRDLAHALEPAAGRNLTVGGRLGRFLNEGIKPERSSRSRTQNPLEGHFTTSEAICHKTERLSENLHSC